MSQINTSFQDTGSDNPYLKMAQECQNPKFQKILYVLAKREDGAKFHQKFPNDPQYMDVKIAATDPNFRNRGIMKNLLKATELVNVIYTNIWKYWIALTDSLLSVKEIL